MYTFVQRSSMKRLNYIILAVYLLCLLVVSMSYSGHLKNQGFDFCSFKASAGDQTIWSSAQFDDSSWSQLFPEHGKEKIWWMRFNLDNTQKLDEGKKLGLRLSVSGAHEVFFDGQYLGSNGKVEEATDLASMKYQKLYFIPDSLTQLGSHKLAIRISANEVKKNFKVALGDYIDLAREPLVLSVFIHILAGIFLTLAVIFFFQAQAQNFRADLMLASALAFILLSLLIFEYLKFYIDYSYQFQLYRIRSIEYLSLLLAILSPLYLLFRYKISFKLPIIAGEILVLFSILIFLEGFDNHARWMILASSLLSLGISGYVVTIQEKINLLLIMGILSCILSFFLYYDISLFFGFGMFISSIALDHMEESLEEKRGYQLALLKSKRMEIELLKKNIQPHFLLNTLISLIDVIEEDPREAPKFIHALADLSRIVDEISSETSIPIATELSLCEAYLTLMTYRKEINYSLITNNIDPKDTIPPAILLTVLENGISHNKAIDGKMEFSISYSTSSGSKTYSIFSSGLVREHQNKLEDGIGNQYIKARLEEFCGPDRWAFHSKKDAQAWWTQLQLFKHPTP